jgi:hypothetical protein
LPPQSRLSQQDQSTLLSIANRWFSAQKSDNWDRAVPQPHSNRSSALWSRPVLGIGDAIHSTGRQSDSTGLTTFERNHQPSWRDQIKKAATSVLLMTA